MRKQLLAVTIAGVGWIALLGCNTEAGTREDNAPPGQESPADDMQSPSGESTTGDATAGETGTSATGGQTSLAAEFGDFDQWDTDRNGDVSRTEFNSKFASFPGWSSWDANGDQQLDQNESASAQMMMWDKNGDGQITDDEWSAGTEAMGLDADYKEADADGDGQLSETEFAQWFQGTAWDEWDGDGNGSVERNEAAETIWNMWDGNDDNKIEQDEWREAVEA